MCQRRVLNKYAGHLRSRDAIDEVGGDKGTGTYANIDIQFMQINAHEGLIQGDEGAYLVNTPHWSAAGESKAYAPAFFAAPWLTGCCN